MQIHFTRAARILSVCAGVSAGAQAAETPYAPDTKFSEIFGRAVTVTHAGKPVTDPTFADILASDASGASNSFARDAVKALEAAAPSDCKSLTSLKLPWTRILSVEEVPAAPEAMAHCKVLGVIDKEINFEVDLPIVTGWNGKFLMGGGGGFLGTLQSQIKPAALHRGYATASTDTGHSIPDDVGGSWALRDPERLANFGHRGTHLTQATAKIIIRAYYKKPIAKSYYYGSSGSGRVAMVQAQRYPEDFDGIVAACPAYSWSKGMALSMAWTQQAMYRTAEDQYAFRSVVPPSKVAKMDDAIYAKCDAIDGLKDDLITTPAACKFDPYEDLPRCAAGKDSAACFTRDEIEVIAKVHAGPSNSTGQLWSGWPYGGESIDGAWTAPKGSAYVIGTRLDESGKEKAPGVYASRHYLLGNETMRYLMFNDPTYDLHRFNFETDTAAVLPMAAQVDGDNPDLSGLKSRGGKLLMWVGYSDWAVNAYSTIDYYERVLAKMGGQGAVGDTARLFLMPGTGHCNSSDPKRKTPTTADFLTALEEWVEQGRAPERILASHVNGDAGRGQSMPIKGTIDRTRPLCPYPAVATYVGKGNTNDAANFRCATP